MANLNYTKVIIGGRLVADPELKTTATGVSVTTVAVAVNRKNLEPDGTRKADFFNVTAWRGTAEFLSRYFVKGSCLLVTGTLQNRSWNDQQGTKHTVTEIVADSVDFVDAKGETGSQPKENPMNSYSKPAPSIIPGVGYEQQKVASAPAYEALDPNDDELPF